MEFTIHLKILLLVFLIAAVMGAVAQKTNFCTMGGVSDWVHMGHTGRLRAWLLAIAVALGGLLILEATGTVTLPSDTFPPYRTANFAWLRYVLGGILFGIGMTLGSGCGSRTLVRLGGGNLKSLVVLGVAAIASYYMLWGDIGGEGFFDVVFNRWIAPTTVDLSRFGMPSQELGTLVGGALGIENTARVHEILGGLLVVALVVFVFKTDHLRGSIDNILSGAVVGLAVVAGWYLTGGPLGQEWKDFAEMSADPPSRVAVQSYTFISPLGDAVRYLRQPGNFSLINFGVMALVGVFVGSFLYSLVARRFRIEWFVSGKDFAGHAVGGALMGFGGVLSMGCTIGQGITGVSTLAIGSLLTFAAIIFGAALTMKIQYHLLEEKGFFAALRLGLADLRLIPKPRTAA